VAPFLFGHGEEYKNSKQWLRNSPDCCSTSLQFSGINSLPSGVPHYWDVTKAAAVWPHDHGLKYLYTYF